jgi:hypothetical protein
VTVDDAPAGTTAAPPPAVFALRPAAGTAARRWLATLWRRRRRGETMHVGGAVQRWAGREAMIARRAGRRVGAAPWRAEGYAGAAQPVRVDAAHAAAARRLVALATNDPPHALAFFQRLRFRPVELRIGAMDAARQAKPALPRLGVAAIEVHDQPVLARALARAGRR